MRVPLAFLGACLMAVALFALMLYMVAPPRSQPSITWMSSAHPSTRAGTRSVMTPATTIASIAAMS